MLPEQGVLFQSKILLLRVTPLGFRQSSSSEPALTPSQIARSVREQHWIEIELVDEDGEPVSGEEFLIVAPDNQRYSGMTGGDGAAPVDNILPGECKISFPNLDKDAWRAA